MGDQVGEGPGHVRGDVPADALAVEPHLGAQRQPAVLGPVGHLVGGHQPGAEGDGGVLGLRRAHREPDLVHLQVRADQSLDDV
jgi:hypothetical protein